MRLAVQGLRGCAPGCSASCREQDAGGAAPGPRARRPSNSEARRRPSRSPSRTLLTSAQATALLLRLSDGAAPSAGLQAGVLGQVSWSHRPPGSYAKSAVHQRSTASSQTRSGPRDVRGPGASETSSCACRGRATGVCVYLHEQCSCMQWRDRTDRSLCSTRRALCSRPPSAQRSRTSPALVYAWRLATYVAAREAPVS
jgi:hypothetical protein